MKKIELRRINDDDVQQISKLINNKKIWDNLRDYIPYPYKDSDAENFVRLTKMEIPHQTFGIIADNELCGIIGLQIQNDVHRLSAELGYWIGEKYWNKGIATKSIDLITKYGFNELKLKRIYARVFDLNKVSMIVLEKNNFSREGILRNAIIKNDKISNEHLYARLKND